MKQLLLALHVVLLGFPTAALATCQSDTDCTAGALCQCLRHYVEGAARCDELGGQCATPRSAAEAAQRARATERAIRETARLNLAPAARQALMQEQVAPR